MSSNDPLASGTTPMPEFTGDSQDLVELLDEAVKALSIGGSLQSDGEVRQAVDCLKDQLGVGSASQ